MTGPEVHVEVGRIDGPHRRSGIRSAAVLLAVPASILGIAAFAVLGGSASPPTSPSPSAASQLARATAMPSTTRSVPTATAPPASHEPVDLSIVIPPGDVILDNTHRALPNATPGLVASSRTTLVPGTTYTLLARCAGPGNVRWPAVEDAPFASLVGAVPCDGAVHQALLPVDASVAGRGGISFSYDVAADVHVVVVRAAADTVWPEALAFPLGADGSRPALLGESTDALTVDEIHGIDVVSGLVVRRMALGGDVTVLSVIPASAFPRDARPALFEGSATISRTGYLAVPFEREGDANDAQFAAVFDLTDPLAPAIEVGDRGTGFSWGPDGSLAAFAGHAIEVYSPRAGTRTNVDPLPGVQFGDRLVWTTTGGLLVDRAVEGRVEHGGILHVDGSFEFGRPTAAFAPLGIERVRAADRRTLSGACESGAAGGGCFLVVADANGGHRHIWSGGLESPGTLEALWAADGRSAWLLAPTGEGGGSLVDSPTPTTGQVVARIRFRNQAFEFPRLVGASGDDDAVAIGIDTREVVVVDTRSGAAYRVPGSFAGWADTRDSVYPNTDAG
ncbi:MAG TPA: hypothetical protein VGK63_02650 [Candidatus Limnocylindrales bacterium]